MCTIGCSYLGGKNIKNYLYFKQCDLKEQAFFIAPVEEISSMGIRYLAMKRDCAGQKRAWSGINEYGVAFVAADSYVTNPKENHSDVFKMYLQTITHCKSAAEAFQVAKDFYTRQFTGQDIFMVGDGIASYFIEAYDGCIAVNKRNNGFFASTNHFRMMKNAVPYEENHSTYLRLQRAEQILQNNPNLDGVKETLQDKYFGKSVWSICRYADNQDIEDKQDIKDNQGIEKKKLYYTQASVIFEASYLEGKLIKSWCHYVLNGNPDQGWARISLFNSRESAPDSLSEL